MSPEAVLHEKASRSLRNNKLLGCSVIICIKNIKEKLENGYFVLSVVVRIEIESFERSAVIVVVVLELDVAELCQIDRHIPHNCTGNFAVADNIPVILAYGYVSCSAYIFVLILLRSKSRHRQHTKRHNHGENECQYFFHCPPSFVRNCECTKNALLK